MLHISNKVKYQKQNYAFKGFKKVSFFKDDLD